jgi:taurine dioxygenase
MTGYETLELRPLAGALGAEIGGVDLARPLEPRQFAEIRRAFLEHLVIFFRDQTLTPQQHEAFSARFGALSRMPYVKPLDDHPDIIAVLKEADERKISVFGGAWHSDFSFLDEPPLGSVLYALETPSYGGDTLWSNMYAAYDALSAGMKRLLDSLVALHSGSVYGVDGIPKDLRTSRSIAISRNNPEADIERGHPAIRVHPETGRKALFVNPIYPTRFDGMTREESAPILDFLYAHATRPEFTCRFRWRARSLALWDNRCAMHYAINDYDGQRRLMHRTTIAGDRPVGPVAAVAARNQDQPRKEPAR